MEHENQHERYTTRHLLTRKLLPLFDLFLCLKAITLVGKEPQTVFPTDAVVLFSFSTQVLMHTQLKAVSKTKLIICKIRQTAQQFS